MSAPEQESGAERRRHERTEVSMLVQYRFDTLEDFLAEYSRDLSPGGLFLCTEEPREVGAIIHVQFSLKDGSRLIEGMGRVARVTRPGGPGPAGMGIEFLHFDEDALALVRQLCGAGSASARRPRALEPGAPHR